MDGPQKILVTGGLGFQGFHLVRHWALQGREITVLNTPSDRARRMAAEVLWMDLPSACRMRLVYGSVHDAEILEKVLPAHDAVVHLAAWASVDVSLDRPWPPFEINAQGTYALLDSIRRYVPEARVLIASTCEVYGPAKTRPDRYTAAHPEGEGRFIIPQDEDTPMLPRSPYAATKIAADRFAYAFAVSYNMRLTILRPSNIFGPYQRYGAAGAVIPTFTRAALQGYPLIITGGGQQVREFLYITDLVEAYTLLLDQETPPGEVYNVGSGETRSIMVLADAIQTRIPTTSQILHGGQRVADVTGFLLDSAKLHGLGWKPGLSFDAGLDRYLDWAQDPASRAWVV